MLFSDPATLVSVYPGSTTSFLLTNPEEITGHPDQFEQEGHLIPQGWASGGWQGEFSAMEAGESFEDIMGLNIMFSMTL